MKATSNRTRFRELHPPDLVACRNGEAALKRANCHILYGTLDGSNVLPSRGVLLLKSLPERVLYATIHSWLMYPRSMRGHPMRACCLMDFFRDRCTSGGSVSAIISLGGVLGAVDSWQRMDRIMLAMVSGVMLVMAFLRVVRWAWVSVESQEQHRTWSVVSRHSLHRGYRIKSSLLSLRH
jgi:hypothetical protein